MVASDFDAHIVLFFTRGIGLQDWADTGNLERELALYRRLQAMGGRISFVTHGGRSDLAFADRIPGIDICCNRWGLPARLYEGMIPLLHRRVLRSCDLIKTNQTHGGDVAARVAKRFGKPLVARCGYMWSEFVAREEGVDSRAASEARRLESRVFRAAERVVVTTDAMAADVAERLPETSGRLEVIPNYVDTELFRPLEGVEADVDLIFVGRLAPQKNLPALLEAIESLDIRLRIVGGNGLERELTEGRPGLEGRIDWVGNVANAELPGLMARARAFVLPSLYEGHPKALIEAMACGLPSIAANSPGIRELVEHRETGMLCGTSAQAIRECISTVLADEALRTRLSRRARKYVLGHFSLDLVCERERALIEGMLGRKVKR